MAQGYDTEKKPDSQAVALSYQPGETAPQVVASGRGYVAEHIIETAKEHAVPVHQDAKLVDSLSSLDIGEYIQPELYGVVAEVLVYVDQMDKIKGKGMDGKKK